MRIEDAIKQSKPFKTSREKVMINLIYTSNHIKSGLADYFKPYGITTKQYNVLRILKGAGKPVSTSYIKERLIDKMSDASRIVDRLYQKKWIDKMTCSSDRRLVDVTINDSGNELLTQVSKNIAKLDAMTQTLTDEEAELLSSLLDKLRRSKN